MHVKHKYDIVFPGSTRKYEVLWGKISRIIISWLFIEIIRDTQKKVFHSRKLVQRIKLQEKNFVNFEDETQKPIFS